MRTGRLTALIWSECHTKLFVTAVRISDVGHIEECLISDVVRTADDFAIDNARPMDRFDVASLIARGDEVYVWHDDGDGDTTHDEKVTVLPGQIERLDSLPGHLIHRLT
jgi:hypothetical protein